MSSPLGSRRSGLLFGLGALAAAVFIAGLWLDELWVRFVTKPIPVLLMIAWVREQRRDRYAGLITVGLMASVVGDVFMEMSGQDPVWFMGGIGFFLLAHVLYIAAYVSDARELQLARAIPFALFGVVMFMTLRPRLGDMTYPVLVYTLTICVMMWRAAARAGHRGETTPDERYALAGAIIFAISDSLIAVNKFYLAEPIAALRYAIIVLYWTGQWGITRSAKRQ